MQKKVRLGDLLIQHQELSLADLELAVQTQQETGMKLGNVLIDLGLIDETRLLEFLAGQLDIPFIDLRTFVYNTEIIKKIPETLARRYRAIPIEKIGDSYLLAMADPTDVVAFDELSLRLKASIELAVVREHDMLCVLDDVYRKQDDLSLLATELKAEMGEVNVIEDIEESAVDAPILRLLYSIFEEAVLNQASDVHIEPDRDLIRIRHRIDGSLHEQMIKGKSILSALILRLKLMAKLNISERRLPQDGRFTLQIHQRKIDVRLAVMPVANGEAAVMRLFDQSSRIMKLEHLGMPQSILERYETVLKRSHGMVLVTGPTGCGKSTTLYATLAELNTSDKKIITVEDPVEYGFSRINQVQVHPKIGLTFSNVLRSALRHDPDIIMVGEIRDEETATIALRAAMTGHLVLTTLHTNNAISSPGRLLEMGIPGYLVASALKLVIAQRLIRKNCEHCQEPYKPTEQEHTLLNTLMRANTQPMHFSKGRGCVKCKMTGYKGRIGIYEMLEMNQSMMHALRSNDIQMYIAEAMKTPGYRNLIHWGLDYAIRGLTSIQEVFRLTQDIDDESANG